MKSSSLGVEAGGIEVIDDPVDYFADSDWKMKKIPIGYINVCEQQRHGVNACQSDLTESLRPDENGEDGQLNAVNIAVVDRELLTDYVEFTNRTWGGDRRIEDFVPHPALPDSFVLMIAGHSRLKGKTEIAQSEGIDPFEATIECRSHKVENINDIVRIQLKENIHSGTSSDRAVRAISEAYLWEKECNPRLTKKAFLERNKRVSEGALNDAIAYVSLPPKIRLTTDNGALPFSIGIELARILGPLKEEARRKCGKVEGYQKDPDEFVLWELMLFVSRFNETGRNITNTRNDIRSHADLLRESHAPPKLELDKKVEELKLFSDDRFIVSRPQYTRREVIASLKRFQSDRDTKAGILHGISLEILGLDTTHEDLETDDALLAEAMDLGALALSAPA